MGQKVVVTGHLQGVFKTALDEGYFTTELVADRISFADEKETSRD